MVRTTFDLLAEPVGDLYRGLLNAALSECRQALLVVRGSLPLGERGQTVLRQLQPFLRRALASSEWPGTRLLPPATAQVLWYDYTPEYVEVLEQATGRLYGWIEPELPEDLSLLRSDDDPWLVTIAHEHEGYLRLAPEERNRLVQALPRVAPILGDARDREVGLPAELEVQRLLDTWDLDERLHSASPEGGYGPEAQDIHYALVSGEAGTEAALEAYITAMLVRWYDRYVSVLPEDCATLARTIWVWWTERRRPGDAG